MLFDMDVERTSGSASARESNYDFLSRSNRPSAIEICSWMNAWFCELPPAAKPNFRSRLTASTGDTFNGARFELVVHRMLKKLGLNVEIEREISGTDRKIDFFVYPTPGEHERSVYLEATVSGFGQGLLSSNWNEFNAVRKLWAYFNDQGGLHSNIWLEAEGELRRTLGRKDIVKPIQELLDRYGPEEVRKLHSTGRRWEQPRCQIRDGAWVLTAYLDPPHSSSGVGQVWGPARGGAVDGSTAIRNALRKKASKWRNVNLLGIPLLVAVNGCHSEFDWNEHDDIDVRRAVFKEPNGEEHTGEFHESLRCLAGVIIFRHAVLGNERQSRVQLFKNETGEIPDYLHFLFNPQELGGLLGIES